MNVKRFKFLNQNKFTQFPESPGIYAFKNSQGLLYIGKATNLRERVKNHFRQPAYRDNLFLDRVKKIGYIKTDSEIEALILEAKLIKKYQPKFNIIWRDDKNYFYVGITKEKYPRIFITHQLKQKSSNRYLGPFVEGTVLKQTLKLLRKVFPYRSCWVLPKRPCLWYQLSRCPAPCQLKSGAGPQIFSFKVKIKKECQKNANHLLKVLRGKKKQVLNDLKKEMKIAVKKEDFEKAAKIRDKIFSLEKVLFNAKVIEQPKKIEINWNDIQRTLKKILKTKKNILRIEAYDISNIQGQQATGSMIVFINGKSDKNSYRKFKIKTARLLTGGGPNDIAMLKEVLKRRFQHPEWLLPDLILIDGGIAQLNVALKIKNKKLKIKNKIIILSLAKKENKLYIANKKKPILLKKLPQEISNLFLQLRDEAHRFAKAYHHQLREKELKL